MKTLGIIVEYNPFHNGHLHQIQKAKELTGADYVVVIMSGNFVQRGAPAIINKYNRSLFCLNNEIDLVIELPVCYSCSSAEYFAHAAVSLLDKLEIIDYISFGCECRELMILKNIAGVLADEPAEFKDYFQNYLKSGKAFPLARAKALSRYLLHENIINKEDTCYYENTLSSPNNILAIEYLKALNKIKSRMIPVNIQRIGSDYKEKNLENTFSSATAIRKAIISGSDFESLGSNMPKNVYDYLFNNARNICPIEENDFSALLGNKILNSTYDGLIEYFDVSEELAHRIENNKFNFINFTQFASLIKTREITLTRVNRALLHIILEIKKEDLESYIQKDFVFYIRILGFKKASSDLLTKLKEKTKLPIITKLADADLDGPGKIMLDHNIYADHLYRMITMNKFNITLPNEFTQGIILK